MVSSFIVFAASVGATEAASSTSLCWDSKFLLLCCFLFASFSLFAACRCFFLRKKLAREHNFRLEQMRRELHKTALRYKNLLDDAGDAIFVIDPATGILEEMNRKGIELLGYSKEEFGSLSGKRFVIAQDQRKFASLVRRVRERGMATSGSITFKRNDGTTFLAEINARLIELDDGQVVQAIIRDITYKSRVEREIRQRNRELVILNDIIVRANQNLQLQTVLEITLAEALEVIGADGGGINLQEGRGDTLQFAARMEISQELATVLEESNLTSGIFGQVARASHFYSIADLSQSRHTAARTAATNGWKSFAGVPLFTKGQLVGIMYILTRKERIYSSDEIKLLTTIGHQIGNIIHHARLFEELSWKTEELMRSHRLLETSSHRLAISQERLKQNLELVEKANLELEHLDRMKTHFLGMISHEFKTPLTTIIGGSEFLKNGTASRCADEAKIIDMIYKGGERLNEIVNDLLKLARLESQAPVMSKVSLSLADIFDMLIMNVSQILADRDLTVHVVGLHAIPYFSGDRDYLEEIFAELLENAMKFTPDGRDIQVFASVTTRQELESKREVLGRFNLTFLNQLYDSSYLQVQIKDSGIGISSEDQIKVFDKFYEVGDICNHSTGKNKFQGKGAGLGLAIVKGMVEAHGGMVWVESSGMDTLRNPGSSFFILLPLEEGARQPVFAFMEKDAAYAPERYEDAGLAHGIK